MGIDVASLTPDEKAAILEAAKTLAEQPEDPIAVIASALDLVMAKIEAIEEKVDGVCKTVYEEFIGGINDLASEKQRADRIGGYKEKYGGLFGGPGIPEYLDAEGVGGDKLYELLDEHISKLKESSGEGFNEESEVQNIAKTIGERVSKITGKKPEVEVAKVEEAPVEAPPAEEPKKEEPPKEEEDPMKGLKDHIGKLRERGGQAA
jgi:hypothetical protein